MNRRSCVWHAVMCYDLWPQMTISHAIAQTTAHAIILIAVLWSYLSTPFVHGKRVSR